MSIVAFRPGNSNAPDADTTRQAYSFDMTQPDVRGLVLIDACVPMALAVEFLRLISEYTTS